MEPSTKRTKTTDLISDLPDGLLSKILSFLPITDAAKTPTLSKRWRYVFSTSPLHLDDAQVHSQSSIRRHDLLRHRPRHRHRSDSKLSREQGLQDDNWRAQTIARIVSSHRGPIHRFRLGRFEIRGREQILGDWIRILATKEVRHITLDFPFYDREGNIPMSILSCASLRSLSLRHCWCRSGAVDAVPVRFDKLKMLTLSCTGILKRDLDQLVDGCPVLQSLSLLGNYEIKRFRLRSKSLRSLTISTDSPSDLEELVIEEAPRLERLLGCCFDWNTKVKIVHAPRLEVLGVLSMNCKLFEIGDTVARRDDVTLRTLASSVKILAIDVPFGFCRNRVETAILLLKCFPSLEKLHIKFDSGCKDKLALDFRKLFDCVPCLEDHLKIVVLRAYKGHEPELKFAKAIIEKARALQLIRFDCETPYKGWVNSQRRQLCYKNKALRDAKLSFIKETNTLWDFKMDATNLALSDPFERIVWSSASTIPDEWDSPPCKTMIAESKEADSFPEKVPDSSQDEISS